MRLSGRGFVSLEQRGLYRFCSAEEVERLTDVLTRITGFLRALRRDAACGLAEEMFRDLRRAAASFAGMYFSALCASEITADQVPFAGSAASIPETVSAVTL